jgi:dihydroorotase
MSKILIKNAKLVNEGEQFFADVLIKGQFIEKIEKQGISMPADIVIDAEGSYLLPGAIDDQVHFREPGLTHKADIQTESRAAVAGGVTTFMEMPNTLPPTTTLELLEEKYQRAAQVSVANFSFYLGATAHNLEQILRVNDRQICGVKIFMGSSTGDMLVDDPKAIEAIFSQCGSLIATHCEDDHIIAENAKLYKAEYGEEIPMKFHPLIRSEAACYASSSFAVHLAQKFGSRLHVLHISTAKELELFSNEIPLLQKKITAEACIHHLWFNDADYEQLGSLIKWNPAVKTIHDSTAILQAVIDNRIDVIATDHAPHTMEEKSRTYFQCPSGGPLVQHSYLAMYELFTRGKISLEKIVEKMAHHVAMLYEIDRRGFIREGFYADLTILNPGIQTKVIKDELYAKCKWSPFEGHTFPAQITHTLVSGNLVYENKKIQSDKAGMRLLFNR